MSSCTELLEELAIISRMNNYNYLFYNDYEFDIICGLFLDAMADRMIQISKDEKMSIGDLRNMRESLISEITVLVKTYANVDLNEDVK